MPWILIGNCILASPLKVKKTVYFDILIMHDHKVSCILLYEFNINFTLLFRKPIRTNL